MGIKEICDNFSQEDINHKNYVQPDIYLIVNGKKILNRHGLVYVNNYSLFSWLIRKNINTQLTLMERIILNRIYDSIKRKDYLMCDVIDGNFVLSIEDVEKSEMRAMEENKKMETEYLPSGLESENDMECSSLSDIGGAIRQLKFNNAILLEIKCVYNDGYCISTQRL